VDVSWRSVAAAKPRENAMSLDTLEPTSAVAEDVIALWPGAPPEPTACGPGPEQTFSQGVPDERQTPMLRNVVAPTLTVCRPAQDKANGVGVIVCPGGGWRILAWEHEGTDLAGWLTERGYTAFLLKYRLMGTPSDPAEFARVSEETSKRLAARFASGEPPKSLGEVISDPRMTAAQGAANADGRQALALVRERAAEWGVKPDRVGMIGFSAGAFLTADVAMNPGGAPLAFAAPIYGGTTGGRAVPADAPPLFSAVAEDDRLLLRSVQQLYLDWSKAGRPAEFHVFARGGHGFGMARQGLPVDRWIELFEAWLAERGFA
jgi:acetyl esterase/lipase